MELKELYPFILMIVLVGMIIGIGVITLDKFQAATFYTVSGFNQTVAGSSINNNSHVALALGNVTSFSKAVNNTGDTIDGVCYQVNSTGGTFQYINTSENCRDIGTSIDLIYDAKDYDTATKSATSSASSEVAGIGTNWLGLIVTVAILAIVLFLVVRSFGSGMRR